LECELVANGLYDEVDDYDDPRVKALEPSAKNWRLLLQIDSDEEYKDGEEEEEREMMWGDCGLLYFWIRLEDLQNKNFEKTWLIEQCY
jgi:uncharacterized protein YwqG